MGDGVEPKLLVYIIQRYHRDHVLLPRGMMGYMMAVGSVRKSESEGGSCIGNCSLAERGEGRVLNFEGQPLRRTSLGVQASISSLSRLHI